MCQVTSFNLDHEKCIEGCNCCKSKDSAASVSAELKERERIIKLIENETLKTNPENNRSNYDKLVWDGIREQLIALIKGETNE